MKKDFSIGEQILIASPFLLISLSGTLWQVYQSAAGSPPSGLVAQGQQAHDAYGHPEHNGHPEHDGHPTGIISATPTPTPEPTPTPTANPVNPVVAVNIEAEGARSFGFSPDSKRLAVFVESSDESLDTCGFIYDLESGSKVSDLKVPPRIAASKIRIQSFLPPAWSPDGKLVVSVPAVLNSVNDICIWEVASGKVKGEYRSPFFIGGTDLYSEQPQSPLYFSADGKTLRSERFGWQILDVETGKPSVDHDYMRQRAMRKPRDPQRPMSGVDLGIDTTISYDRDYNPNRFVVKDAKTKKILWAPQVQKFGSQQWLGDILCVTNNPKREKGKVQGEAHLWLWNGRTRKLLPSPPLLADSNIGAYAFNPDKSTIAYFNQKPTAKNGKVEKWGVLTLWNYRQNRVVWRTETSESLKSIQWSPNGKWLIAFKEPMQYRHDAPETIYAFDATGKLRYERDIFMPYFLWSPDGKSLAVRISAVGKMGIPNGKSIEVQRFED